MKTNPKINISKLISVLIISVFLCSMLSISVSANTNGPTLLRQDQFDNTAGTFLDKKSTSHGGLQCIRCTKIKCPQA